MRILVDTSVWINYFSKSPTINTSFLDTLLQTGSVVTCMPIVTELFSGKMSPATKRIVRLAFQSIESIDPDWNNVRLWDQLVEMAQTCHNQRFSVPGLVDRMIIAAVRNSGASLWTLDKKLNKLAHALAVLVVQGRKTPAQSDTDEYAMTCQRYIYLNQIRARMFNKVRDTKWSSYDYYAYGKKNDLITPGGPYKLHGREIKIRQMNFRIFVETMMPHEEVLGK